MVWKSLPQPSNNERLRGSVGLGDGVDRALEINLRERSLGKGMAHDSARLVSNGNSGGENCLVIHKKAISE
jgi:hypothetical protein